ncbi:hypothetical protein ABZZ74_07510 [Streptomyces sp. NPDC006476]|uniref:hypothetical protein n=1 Tax=Streptomyces sp. NPDC006476 TaxID=3157175 RepID=UPI0033B3C20C
MVRYVHQELGTALALLAATAVGVVVAVAVHGSPPVRADRVWLVAVLALGYLLLVTLLRGSRLRWVGEVRRFEAAVPMTGRELGRHRGRFPLPIFVAFVVTTSVFALVGGPLIPLLPLLPTLDWLAKAAVGAHWERGHGRLLWRERDRHGPQGLSYTPITAPAPTRTATDAPLG